jgi:hypothetical protein
MTPLRQNTHTLPPFISVKGNMANKDHILLQTEEHSLRL